MHKAAGDPLGEVLSERRLSLAGLAELYVQAVAVDGLRSSANRNLIWKWKTGRRTPTAESQAYLADALGVPRSVIDEETWPDWLRYALSNVASLLESPWSLEGTMQVLDKMAENLMDRREFAVITGATLMTMVRHWGEAVASASSAERHDGDDRSATDLLSRLDNRLADLRNLDDALGGTELRKLAVAEFRWLVHLAKNASYDTESERRLFSLLAEAARLCGWLHFDALHHSMAQSYYVTALRCSATAGDPMTGANILACMSFQAALTEHHQEAVSLIDSAQQQVRHSATPRLRALLASRKARAYAKAGDVLSCGHALNEAERSLDKAATGPTEPDWLYYFDEAELAAQAGACWVDLRQPRRARPLIDNALNSMNPHYVRDRAIYHVRSAEAYMHERELEPACHQLRTAAGLAHQTGSIRSHETLCTARLGLSPYKDEVVVRELDAHIQNYHDLSAPQ